jgi:hypothetical protein
MDLSLPLRLAFSDLIVKGPHGILFGESTHGLQTSQTELYRVLDMKSGVLTASVGQ